MIKESFNTKWTFYKEGSDQKQTVDLPHDAMINEPRDPNSPGGRDVAFFTGGVYHYEKTFFVPDDWRQKHVLFEFEGVYHQAKVFLNGKEAGGVPYGYRPFTVEADAFLRYGQDNTIKVTADNSQLPNSRWYTGSGIYRPVWLYHAGKSFIWHEGVKITTLSIDPARILIETKHTGGEVGVCVLYKGEIVAQGSGDQVTLEIPDAHLWSAETPDLYQCRVTLTQEGFVLDEVEETFGIRNISFDRTGFYINGKRTLLRGGCVHHDNGILGARSFAESEARRVRILKEAGYNAIRSAHNPASKAMIEACDLYGLYVMDETWDMWYRHKTPYDYATHFMQWYRSDIRALVDRDYNHPSVVFYSIGNEVTEPATKEGVDLAREMTEMIHELDPSRPVTAGINLMLIHMAKKGKNIYKDEGGLAMEEKPAKKKKIGSTLFNLMTYLVGTQMNKAANSKKADEATSPVLDVLDIAGYNYASGRYKKDGKKHPERVIVGTETFPMDISKNWAMVKQYPYLIGDFMWTAWDYLGEVGIGAWSTDESGFNKPYPWLLADVGAIDILGHIGAEAAYAKTVWGLQKEPYIGVRPVNKPGKKPSKSPWRGTNALDSWSWRGCEGNQAMVEVYTDAASVELKLNGKQIGKKKVKNQKALFKTTYMPGTLEAIACDKDGKELKNQLVSATGDLKIRVAPEKQAVKPGEIVYVNIDLVGENDIVESNSDIKLSVLIEGGTLLAFGSANPCTEERYGDGCFTTYYGRSLAVVRAKDENITIRVDGSPLPSETAIIQVL